jgi:CDP-diglyceride synthetase
MTQRVLTGVLLAAGGLLCAQWPLPFALLVLAVALTSLWELAGLIARKGSPIETPVAIVAVVCYLVLTYIGSIKRYESELLAATLIFALIFASFTGKGNNISRSGFTLLSVLYVGKLTSYFIAIRDIPQIGLALTIFVIAEDGGGRGGRVSGGVRRRRGRRRHSDGALRPAAAVVGGHVHRRVNVDCSASG